MAKTVAQDVAEFDALDPGAAVERQERQAIEMEKPHQPPSRLYVFQEKAKTLQLPLPPWTHEALGEAKYCEIASELGFFNPKSEQKNYRPNLDPAPFLEIIRAQAKQ